MESASPNAASRSWKTFDREPPTPYRTALRDEFRCPGEAYSISHAVHLGRLASYYPACRGCAHRADVRLLPPPIVRGWSEVLNRPEVAASFTAEGYEARFDGRAHHRQRAARSRWQWAPLSVRSRTAAARVPQVLLGGDGHWSTADLINAASEALVWAGCRAVDVGAVTTPALACGASSRRRRSIVDRQCDRHAACNRAALLWRRQTLVVAGRARRGSRFGRVAAAATEARRRRSRARQTSPRTTWHPWNLGFMRCGRCGSSSIRPASLGWLP